jgi:ribonuclease R
MFMVEANEAVARTFDALNVPLLRRIHPDPMPGDIEELRMYARGVGQGVPEEPTRHDLQRLLDATRDTPASRAIHFAVLRTLASASYSPAIVGHFALASEHYAHFTSPIRRYPDLTVHRVIEAYLDATDNGHDVPGGKKRRALGRRLLQDSRVPDEDDLVKLGAHCTATEDEAEQAERELRNFLVMQFLLEHHLGDDFSGVITGTTGRGVYVSIERFLVEGMVPMQEMPAADGRADQWRTDERTGRLVAGRSGASIGIGDLVTVQIQKIDLASRQMDLRITELPKRAKEPPKVKPLPADRGRGQRKGYKQGRRGRKGG